MPTPDQTWLHADWPVPTRFRAVMTRRAGGTSLGRWGDQHGRSGLNLGAHVGDDTGHVADNRRRLTACLPGQPRWLNQVHGTRVMVFDADDPVSGETPPPIADAAVTRLPGVVLAVLTADCLPVALCDPQAGVIGLAHAGWRGLAAGVLENTIHAMISQGASATRLRTWFGVAIGPRSFEVGPEVLNAFCAGDPACEACFTAHPAHAGKFLANLYGLAGRCLERQGVAAPLNHAHDDRCSVIDRESFYSFRRDGITGRQATLAWMTDSVAG